MQKLLGELHDCDVWAHILAMAVHTHHKQYLEREKGSISVYPIEPVLVNILLNRKTQRDLTYTRLSTVWQMCHSNGIWRDLRAEIDAAAQTTPAKETMQKVPVSQDLLRLSMPLLHRFLKEKDMQIR